ncbi:MET12 [Brettanomyces bruxellensis]|uniref:DEBR0S2_02674g1_1 n=1 Tax=Dekkera bruxellensis TaxID=5007 RepID=A0A7D9H338_DEKBR|nr:MET12 [Brettanomyces bruxellensis]
MSMKITDKINALDKDEPFFSFEFFPPKTEHGMRNLYARLGRMSLMGPLFVTVTWGAGGTTAEKSVDLAITCQKELGLTTCLHLTCTNTTKKIIDKALASAKAAGIRNILALRGDPSRTSEVNKLSKEEAPFQYAVDLVKYIREQYGDYFCIGVAGYPEGHADGFYDESQDPHKDMPFLVEKINAGADFVLTQLFFDDRSFINFDALLRSQADLKNKEIPVIPGLMPINSYDVFKRATKLAHATIPDSVLGRFSEEIQCDDDRVKEIGVDIMTEMIEDIHEKTSVHTRGFHFYTLNLEKSIAQIVNRSSLLSQVVDKKERELEECVSDSSDDEIDDNVTTAKRAAYMNRFKQPTNQIIVEDGKHKDSAAKTLASRQIKRRSSSQFQKIMSISSGHGALGKDATWDDHPNGRFGDTRSPAFGSSGYGPYGPSLHVTPEKAFELWGQPETMDDVSSVFVNYLSRKVDAIPWNEMSINPETALIQEPLIILNQHHRFTMSSQPACNCAQSADKIFGWGPAHGYVYQKAYVEMFVSKEDWKKNILPKLKGNPDVSYYVGDSKSYFDSSLKAKDTNCVTWGVFPDRQIVQTTVVNEDSFKAWKDEGFQIWREWMMLYPGNSPSANVLKEVLDGYYLTAIVHHDYPDEDALWDLLVGDTE